MAGESKAAQLINAEKAFAGLCHDTYYGYSTLLGLYQAERDVAHIDLIDVLVTFGAITLSFMLLLLQAVASYAVHQNVTALGDVTDDDGWADFSPSGADDPHRYRYAYAHTWSGVPRATVCVVTFAYALLAGPIMSEARQIVLTFAAIHEHSKRSLASLHGKVLWFFVVAQYLARVTVFILFLDSTVYLIGFSDGPFEILINCLASAMILEIDDIVAKVTLQHWLPPTARGGILRAAADIEARRTAEAIANHNALHALEHAAIVHFLLYLVFVPFTYAIQKSTASGECMTNYGRVPDHILHRLTFIKPVIFFAIGLASFNILRRLTNVRRAAFIAVTEFLCLVLLFYTCFEAPCWITTRQDESYEVDKNGCYRPENAMKICVAGYDGPLINYFVQYNAEVFGSGAPPPPRLISDETSETVESLV